MTATTTADYAFAAHFWGLYALQAWEAGEKARAFACARRARWMRLNSLGVKPSFDWPEAVA
jgi:hypothetical protein